MTIPDSPSAITGEALSHKVNIRLAAPEDAERWNNFVAVHPQSNFFQRYDWARFIANVYGYRAVNLIAEKGQSIVGVLPLTLVTSPITGRALISSAFAVGGGILSIDEEASIALANEASRLGGEANVDYVELRSEQAHLPGWRVKSSTYVGFSLPIEPTQEGMFNAIPRKRRAELRKALKLEADGKLVMVEDKTPERFFSLYARALRDLGTPVFAKKFIMSLYEEFKEHCDILTVEYEGAPVVSLVSFYHGKRVMPYYIGALPVAKSVRAFDYIYWQQIIRAQEKGITCFDFGRSKVNAGSYGFKKTWGITPVPLEYQYHLVRADAVPDVNPDNPKFALATKIWRQLPVPLAILGGRIVARHFA